MTIITADYFNAGIELHLPSMPPDLRVLARKVDLISLLDLNGEIPDPLTNMVLAALAGGAITKNPVGTDPKELMLFTELINRTVVACLVQPAVTTDPDPPADSGLVPIQRLSFEDKLFLFNWAIGGNLYAKSATFPEKPTGSVAIVSKVKPPANKPRR